MTKQPSARPSPAFVGASWGAMIVGILAYLIGLWNAQMQLNEKGYYLTILLYGCFAAVSLQKTVRDRAEGLPVTGMYVGLCWTSLMAAVVLLTCAAWAWLALTVTVAEAARGATVVRRSSRPWLLPAGARRLVLAGCGVALTAGVAQPAMAGTGDWPAPRGVAALSGLPLPDRAAVPPHRHATTDSGTARLPTPTATTVPDATTGPAATTRPTAPIPTTGPARAARPPRAAR